jgi:hypothetical protein
MNTGSPEQYIRVRGNIADPMRNQYYSGFLIGVPEKYTPNN